MTFNADDEFGEYQDGDTDGEADDSSDSSEDKLYEDDKIDNDWSKTISATKVDYATDIGLPYRTSSVFHT